MADGAILTTGESPYLGNSSTDVHQIHQADAYDPRNPTDPNKMLFARQMRAIRRRTIIQDGA